MKIEKIITWVKSSPYDKVLWLSIFKPHKYESYPDKDFCVLCDHSKMWHLENKWSNK